MLPCRSFPDWCEQLFGGMCWIDRLDYGQYMHGSKSAILCINSSFFQKYHKIPKISPGAYIFQKPFLRGLYSEGLIYGGKFAFQNWLG